MKPEIQISQMLTWRVVAAVGVLSIVVGGTAIAVASRPRSSIKISELAQPDTWVPFKAQVQVFKPGRPTVVGMFYRRSDGSTRLETGPEDGSATIVAVRNIPTSTYYVRGLKGRWSSRPMTLPDGGYHPLHVRSTTTGLRMYPYKVALRVGESGSLQAESGFLAFNYVNPSGDSALLVPDLNFFAVVRQSLSGRREVYSQIEVGPQPDDLFVLPPGEVAEFVNVPGGIVTQPIETAPHRIQGHAHE